MPGVGVAPDELLGRAGHVRAGTPVGPRSGVDAVAHRDIHQLVIGRVVLDLVDPVAVAVIRVQHRRVDVGQPAPLQRLRTSAEPTQFAHLGARPAGAFASQTVLQRRVVRRVEVDQRRRLVEDVMGRDGNSSTRWCGLAR